MTTSRQDVAEDALLALLEGDATLAGLLGPPGFGSPASPMAEHVWISEQGDVALETSLTGGTRPELHETFTIRVVVFVAQTGDDRAAARNRSTELAAIVEDLVRANSHLAVGQADVWYAEVVAITRRIGSWDTTTGVLKTLEVRVQAFLPGA